MSDDAPIRVSPEVARRLIVTKQGLGGERRPSATPDTILGLVRDLGFVQWDPVPIVAPSHLLSFWARLDGFRPAQLERLMWEDRALFEHWTPIASIVRTEDYPLFLSLMRRYPESLTHSWGNQRYRTREYLAEHAVLRRKILRELAAGTRTTGEFTDHLRTRRDDGEWTPSSDVAQMLYHLTMSGEVMVVGHRGAQNLWGLSEGFLPDWVVRTPMGVEEFERTAAERAVRALGVATPREITLYFVKGRYTDLPSALKTLERAGRIRRVETSGHDRARDVRYIHEADLPTLDTLHEPERSPRIALLPPFDTMVYSQARGQRLFGFDYVREQFLPKEKRRHGTYVLPILRGASFIGRIDPRMDRETRTLTINAVHAEPGAPMSRQIGEEVAASVVRLAEALGAERVGYTRAVPKAWAPALRGARTDA